MKADTGISEMLIRGIARSGLPALMRNVRPPGLSILKFGGIAGREYRGTVNCSEQSLRIDKFHGICQLLAGKYQVIPLAEAVAVRSKGMTMPKRSVVLTFDGGYASTYHLAFPLLKRYRLPATMFLTTDFVHNKDWLWTDRIEYALHVTRKPRFRTRLGGDYRVFSLNSSAGRIAACQEVCRLMTQIPQSELGREVGRIECELDASLDGPVAEIPSVYKPLDWEQAREMSKSGLISFGAHTHRHRILSRCTKESIEEELRTCADLMEANLGIRPEHFAYPNGAADDFNQTTREALERQGFRCALTAIDGFNDQGRSLFEMQRHRCGRDSLHTDVLTSGALQFLKKIRSPIQLVPPQPASTPRTA